MPESNRDFTDASRYVAETRQMDREEGSVLACEDIDLLQVPTERDYDVARLEDYGGITFFSLGPLYIALQIPFNIVETFAADTGMGDFEKHVIYFAHPVIRRLGPWRFILEGIPDAVAGVLFQYLDTQVMVRREEAIYAKFLRRDVSIADPFGVDRQDLLPGEDPARIVVYVPSTNQYRIDLADPPPGPPPVSLDLLQWPAQEDVVTEGAAVLGREHIV